MRSRSAHNRRPLPAVRAASWWAWLVVCAVLLRGLIPAGFMPNPNGLVATGGPFILCASIHDALTATSSPHAHHDHAHQAMGPHRHDSGTPHVDAPCIFAAVTALAVGLAIVILVLRPVRYRNLWALAAAQIHPVTKPPGAQPARGPPPIFS